MKITEIKMGTKLNIEAKMGRNSINFESTSIMPMENYLLISEIKDERNRPISLATPNVDINLSFAGENKVPVVWEHVLVKHVFYKNKPYHCVYQRKDGNETNRRGAPRLYLGINIQCQLGLNKSIIAAVLKDISETGFCIITSEKIDVGPGNEIRAVFTLGPNKFDIKGYPVRSKKLQNGQDFVYGCKLKARSKDIAAYVQQNLR